MRKVIHIFFFGLVVVHFTGIMISNETLVHFSKPALVSTLLLWFLHRTQSYAGNARSFFGLGLLFSIIGDTVLMSNGKSSFLLGLSSFLIAHIFYILAFFKYPNFQRGILFKKRIVIIPVAIYLLFFQFAIFDNVPSNLRIPVILYSLIISLMLLSSINLVGRVSNQFSKLVILGAILFLLSDSILAGEKFGMLSGVNNTLVRISVMATYLAGQYFLTKGFAKVITNV